MLGLNMLSIQPRVAGSQLYAPDLCRPNRAVLCSQYSIWHWQCQGLSPCPHYFNMDQSFWSSFVLLLPHCMSCFPSKCLRGQFQNSMSCCCLCTPSLGQFPFVLLTCLLVNKDSNCPPQPIQYKQPPKGKIHEKEVLSCLQVSGRSCWQWDLERTGVAWVPPGGQEITCASHRL